MSEYVKTKKDKAVIAANADTNPVVIYLRNKENMQFKAGDILVLHYKDHDHNDKEVWTASTHTSGAPKKYLYAFEDDVGLGYVKLFKADGKLSETPEALTEFNLDCARFSLDPQYADHLMIGDGEFDPTETQNEMKKFRASAILKNRKLKMPTNNAYELIEWIKTLKVGDTLYNGSNIPSMVANQYKIAKINLKTTVSDIKERWQRERMIERLKLKPSDIFPQLTVVVLKSEYEWTVGTKEDVDLSWFYESCLTTKDPFPLVNNI